MKLRRLRWLLYPSYILVLILALLPLTWFSTGKIRRFHFDELEKNLEIRALIIADEILLTDTLTNPVKADALCKRIGSNTCTRVTIVLPMGRVIGDTDEDPAVMDNHMHRPEIKTALRGTTGTTVRHSNTLGLELMYVGVPLISNGRTVGVVRTSIPVTNIEEALEGIRGQIISVGCFLAVIALIVSFYMSLRISRPLEELRRATLEFARGNLDVRLSVKGCEEVSSLAEAMNEMARDLDNRIRTVVQERNEREAVFASMLEGVLAIDGQERIMHLNNAARRLLAISFDNVEGMSIQEAIRNVELQNFVALSLTRDTAVESNIAIHSHQNETHLQCHGTPLKDAEGQRVGVLVVLNDITRLRRLENIRRDFVANVSHELRTPLTSIKGFAETLLDGAAENPQDLKRFLSILDKHVDHLSAIIEDLLTLSRIEHDAEAHQISLTDASLYDIVKETKDVSTSSASEKDIDVRIDCPTSMAARVNPLLLRQAVLNLVDNAIKYSPEETAVTITVEQDDSETRIIVSDQGPGIDKKHHERLFERFYRVDKGRSRTLGGTGLGLAIVKHIAMAHNGRITLESAAGSGSAFTIHIPIS